MTSVLGDPRAAKILDAAMDEKEAKAILMDALRGGLNLDRPDAIKNRLVALRGETASPVRSMLDRLDDTPVSFADAKALLLKEAGFDLEKARTQYVRQKVLWGHVGPRKSDAFGSAFDEATLSSQDLVRDIIPALKKGEKFHVGFNIGSEPVEHAFANLRKSGVRTFGSVEGYETPKDDLEARGPSVIFTQDSLSVPQEMTEKTADFRLQQARRQGLSYLEPQEWMDYFLSCADRGLVALNPNLKLEDMSPEDHQKLLSTALTQDKSMDPFLPDVQTCTQYPRHRNTSGRPLCLSWHPHADSREVYAHDWLPQVAGGYLGPRLAFGRFLS